MVRFIEDMTQWDELMELSKTKLVLVDFTATWCGPCQFVAPFFEELSENYTSIEFVKVDVDDADDVAGKCGVQAMPTFHFYKDSKKVDELQGADLGSLMSKITSNSGDAASGPPEIRHIEDMDSWKQLIELSKTKLVVVDFTAQWCGPCKMVSPFYALMSTKHTDIEFVKVDVDEADDVAASCGVQAMPTFHIYKGGNKVDELKGANLPELKKLIAKHEA